MKRKSIKRKQKIKSKRKQKKNQLLKKQKKTKLCDYLKSVCRNCNNTRRKTLCLCNSK